MKTIGIALLISVGLFVSSCATKTDPKFLGMYIDTTDSRGEITIFDNGKCHVAGASGPTRLFDIVIDGATAHLELASGQSPAHGSHYPEFSGKNATFVISQDTIITPTGKRFVKESRK